MQSLVLDKFDYGIISNPDAEDISDKAAVSSLNIDGDNEDGKLKGIPTSSEHLLTASASFGNVRLGKFIENEGVFDLIYHDSSANKINRIADFYVSGDGAKTDLVTSNVSDNTCIQINNKEAHIGTGNGSANVPLWCGRPTHQTFGGIGIVSPSSTINGVMWAGGTYTGSDGTYRVQIDANTPDTFKWSDDNGSTWEATGVTITGENQTLSNGLVVRFQATSGHTIGHYWNITVYAQETFVSETAYLTSLENGVSSEYVSNPFDASAEIRFSTSVGKSASADTYFDALSRYRYKFSVVYDGYQESPLSHDYLEHYDGTTNDYAYLDIVLLFDNYNGTNAFDRGDFSERITGVKLYRADSPTGSNQDFGLYHLIQSIDINDAVPICVKWDSGTDSWLEYSNGTAVDTDDYNHLVTYLTTSPALYITPAIIIRDTGTYGASYTEETGMPQSLTDVALNYSLSAEGNGYHFVGKGYYTDISDASNYIFRSKELRYDQFDYVNDFLVMPRTPTALEFYEGKLYAFDSNHIYRINPEGLYIEDVFEGVGALGQRSALSTAYGLFFCNDNGAYAYRNGQVEPISERIKVSASGGVNWQTLLNTTISDTMIAFDSLRNQVLFIATSGSAVLSIWAYHVIKDRWDYWTPYSPTTTTITLTANSGVITGKDGELFISNNTNTYALLRGGSQMGWEWTSKEFNLNKPSQDKWWGAIQCDPTTNVTLTYGVEGASPVTAYTHGTLLDTYKKSLQIKLAGTTTTEVDSVEIMVRPQVGMRVY